ncbi:MAG TPA: Tol-Pal system beta propeller repeat protein TolB [Gammaproteobacteria bacterium]|nr:Tol-Pal system beta propeller repeat protein TolB [Gammaproteobacteria bacterium]
MKYIRLCMLALCGYAAQANALLEIKITGFGENALPIAIVPFGWDAKSGQAPEDIAGIVTADLSRTGQFKPMPSDDMLEQPHSPEDIHFENWRIGGIGHLVVGMVRPMRGNHYTVEFRLFDVYKGALGQMEGHSYTVPVNDLRRVGHDISDIVYKAITGERGAFSTHIAYVAATMKDGKPEYRLEVSDTDGYNARSILRSRQPIMSPSWSPDGRSLAYVSFENRRSEIFVYSVFINQGERVAAFEGINAAPSWSPDGKSLAVTLSRGGNADIYLLSLATKQLTQLTRNSAIDTEPVWMPDGKSLVFTSGRGGNPQIYRLSLSGEDGERPQRLTFEGDYNASPAVSPDGRSIAMVHRDRGNYSIALLDLKSGLFRVLTDGRLDETPSFAPNGSMLLYASQQDQKGVLAAVSIDGRTRQRLALHEGDIREPTWAPFPQE